MARYRGFTEWDSTLEQREGEAATNSENPFEDRSVRDRIGEIIARAVAGAKKPLTRRRKTGRIIRR
jgi:hypothetical protein